MFIDPTGLLVLALTILITFIVGYMIGWNAALDAKDREQLK